MSSGLSSSNKQISPHARSVFGIVGAVASSGLVFFIGQIAAAVVLLAAIVLTGSGREQAIDMVETNTLAQLVVIVLGAVFTTYGVIRLLRWQKQSVKKALLLTNKPNGEHVVEVFLTYAGYFVTLIIVTTVLRLITSIDVEQQQQLGVGSSTGAWSIIATFFMLVVVPPIYEELLFRGYLFSQLRRYLSLVAAGVVTSVIFGAAHLEYNNLNWIAAIDTLLFSGYLVFISQRHQSIYSSMLLHAIKNLVAFSVLFLFHA